MNDLDPIRNALDKFDASKARWDDKEAEHLYLDEAAWAIIRAYRSNPGEDTELDALADRLLKVDPPTEWGWYA